ncbi:MAG TPA: hypothetical protein VMM78_04260 [Thermomicrobiales bacterium]|nr:hypothetical protein [Thermomicrobiales bacterium]
MRWLAIVCGLLALSLVIAACNTGSDSDVVTPTAEAAVATSTRAVTAQETPSPPAESTPTVAVATATSPAATVAASTATTAPLAPTPTETDAATATVAATATTLGDVEDLLGEIETLDPDLLPNYTLTFRMDAAGIPEEPEPFTFEMEVQQAAVDNYHMRVVAIDTLLEVWVVDDVTYLTQDDGSITSIPGTDMAFFSPSMFLSTVPPLEAELEAARVGEETINGRETTRYRITGEDYLTLAELSGTDEAPTDVSGEVNVWIDNELNIMIRQEADVTWTNDDGTEGRLFANYDLGSIGSTARVEAPQ